MLIPETGQKVLLLTTPEQENKLGLDGYKETLAKSKINRDPRLNGILDRVGGRIAAQTGKRDFKWGFTIIESPEQNAWCMPGGKVAFYTGILKPLQNEAAMAAVMGHEVEHAILRHSGQQITREMIVNLGLSAADLGLKYMAEAGYDPRDAVRFWERFSRSAGAAPPEFFSTHPGSRNRIRDLQSRMSQALRWYENAPRKIGIGESLT